MFFDKKHICARGIDIMYKNDLKKWLEQFVNE